MIASVLNPYDIFSPEARGNHALYDRMRMDDPVHRAIDPLSGQPVWFLTRYDHCVSFLKDRRFSKQSYNRVQANPPEQQTSAFTHATINRHMLNLDEPDHARLKSLVHKAFTASRVDGLRLQLAALADSLLQALDNEVADGAEFDLTGRYAEAFSLLSIMTMLGIPSSDYAQFQIWTKTMLLSTDDLTAQTAIIELSMYLHRQIDLRHEQFTSTDDLLTGLILAEDAGDRLTRQELLAMVFLLFAAGYETVTNFISNGVLALQENPDQRRLLRENLDNPTLVNSAMEEILRYKCPSYMTLASWAIEDVELGGKVIQKGDSVHAVLDAANHDPSVFEQPDKFDIRRCPNRHIAFSRGIHYCLGASLARLEGEIALTTLLRWMPEW